MHMENDGDVVMWWYGGVVVWWCDGAMVRWCSGAVVSYFFRLFRVLARTIRILSVSSFNG